MLILVLVGVSGILKEDAKRVVVYASIAVGFFAFCGLVSWNVLIQICYKIRSSKAERELASLDQEIQHENSNSDQPLLSKTIISIKMI